MHYRGRHRQVAHQRWSRRTGTVATIVCSALIAPLTFSGPVASEADTRAQDTLANHAEWLLSAAHPAVAAQIAELKAALTKRGVPYTVVSAYRVPTVEGFTTFVTANPQTMVVRPNPELLERTPEGTTPVPPAEVMARLVESAPAGITDDLGSIYVQTDDISRTLDVLADLARTVVDRVLDNVNPSVPDPDALVTELRETTDPVVTEVLDAELSAIVTEVVPFAAAAPPGPSEIMANPNLPNGARDDNDGRSATWSTRNKDCYNVASEAFSRVVCWRIDGQDKDSDSNRNFWQFHIDASGKSVGYRSMNRMWMEARPSPQGATNQAWDALPKPSAQYGGSEGCSTSGDTFTIASGAPVQVGFGWYWERTSCENYYPKSYGDDGHWASVWEGNPNVKPEVHRAVMLKVPVKTPPDKGVMWELLTGQRTE